MSATAIEWTDATWNPVTGCSKISPGCAHCYAETISLRFGRSLKPWTPENAAENVVLHPDRLEQPLRWKRPRMVFVNSMSDLFHEHVPDDYIDQVFARMVLCDGRNVVSYAEHTFQVLTKRPERALAYMSDLDTRYRVGAARTKIAVGFRPHRGGFDWNLSPETWPPKNVWLGVSIENARYTWRADVLREIPAAVRFISAEPLLGSLYRDDPVPSLLRDGETIRLGLKSLDLTGIDWLIVGGESGHQARPMDAEWARELRDACLEQCPLCDAGDICGECVGERRTAFFFKQWGGRTPKAGGRLLDGREWNEMPA